MDSITFHIDADKADANLLNSIKAYFGNRRIQVTVKPEETLSDLITRNESAGHEYALPYDELVRIANALDEDKSVDVVSEIQKFKVVQLR